MSVLKDNDRRETKNLHECYCDCIAFAAAFNRHLYLIWNWPWIFLVLFLCLLFFLFFPLSFPFFISFSFISIPVISFLALYLLLSIPSLLFPWFLSFFPFSSYPVFPLISFNSFPLPFSFPFLFPFISPHPLAQLTHLADLTNEDTTHLSLILLYPTPPSLHLPPPALLHPSADKMVKACVAAAALPAAAHGENSIHLGPNCVNISFSLNVQNRCERWRWRGSGEEVVLLSVSVCGEPPPPSSTHLDRMTYEPALGVNCHHSGNGKSWMVGKKTTAKDIMLHFF